jgi:hypothetical protein
MLDRGIVKGWFLLKNFSRKNTSGRANQVVNPKSKI